MTSRKLNLLPVTLRGTACNMCERTQSSWWTPYAGEDDDKLYLCALCVMYETEWGRRERPNIEGAVMDFQKGKDRVLEKDESNRLVHIADADAVLAVIVLSTKVAKAQSFSQDLADMGLEDE